MIGHAPLKRGKLFSTLEKYSPKKTSSEYAHKKKPIGEKRIRY